MLVPCTILPGACPTISNLLVGLAESTGFTPCARNLSHVVQLLIAANSAARDASVEVLLVTLRKVWFVCFHHYGSLTAHLLFWLAWYMDALVGSQCLKYVRRATQCISAGRIP